MFEKICKGIFVFLAVMLWWAILCMPGYAAEPVSQEEIRSFLIHDIGVDSVLFRIARCESGFRQYGKGGVALRGINPLDIGLFQVNLHYHGERADKLGFNVFTLRGNIAYTKWLFDREGTTPWNASKKCWNVS